VPSGLFAIQLSIWETERAHARFSSRKHEEKEEPMRVFECGSLVPGCEWHTRADEDAEVIRRTVEHMRTAHGETLIRETMVQNIRQRIHADNDETSKVA